jgi:hypothetical protein
MGSTFGTLDCYDFTRECWLPDDLRFCDGARRGPRVPQGIHRARPDVHGPDRRKRSSGGGFNVGDDRLDFAA